MRMPVIPAMLALLFLSPGSGLGAGVAEGPGDCFATPSLLWESQQTPLEGAALRFARAWVDRDFRGLESQLQPGGIRLHIQGESFPSVDLERAVGAIRGFLGRYTGGEAELMRVSESPGAVPMGFADFQWRTQVAGSGEAVIFTLFVAIAMEDGAWTVTEIRVLP